MALFVISYDLHKVKDYEPLNVLLRQWKAEKLLESLWLVNLNGSAIDVVNTLKAVVDNDDSVAVIELKNGSDWAGLRLMTDGLKWLRQYVHA